MPTADLRDLAEKLGMLKECHACYDGRYFDNSGESEGCRTCGATGLRLPSEAEVREAIFDAGILWIETASSRSYATVTVGLGGGLDKSVHALGREAGPDDRVLFALMRALEAVRE